MTTERAKPPGGVASVYRWLPLTVKLPVEPETSAEVKGEVLPSPQLIVPEKSLVEASGVASVKVAVSLVGVVPATPPLALTVPGVNAASRTTTGGSKVSVSELLVP